MNFVGNAIENMAKSIDWLARGPFPRWLRRIYILTWPVAYLLRLLAFLGLVCGLMTIILFAGVLGLIWGVLFNQTDDFLDKIRENWK